MVMRKYIFNQDLLGDIEEGRPNLGPTVDLDIYRLMQFTLRDVIEKHVGADGADKIFYEAGKLAGVQFFNAYIGKSDNIEEFVQKAQAALRRKQVGVLRIEDVQLDGGKIILCVDEDLDCSGLPDLGFEVCVYDEGFVAALLEEFSGQRWEVKEIDCWCTGGRTCRFQATRV